MALENLAVAARAVAGIGGTVLVDAMPVGGKAKDITVIGKGTVEAMLVWVRDRTYVDLPEPW